MECSSVPRAAIPHNAMNSRPSLDPTTELDKGEHISSRTQQREGLSHRNKWTGNKCRNKCTSAQDRMGSTSPCQQAFADVECNTALGPGHAAELNGQSVPQARLRVLQQVTLRDYMVAIRPIAMTAPNMAVMEIASPTVGGPAISRTLR